MRTHTQGCRHHPYVHTCDHTSSVINTHIVTLLNHTSGHTFSPQAVMRAWVPLSEAVLAMAVSHMPSPPRSRTHTCAPPAGGPAWGGGAGGGRGAAT